jgi:hypothetical protein
MNANFVNKQRVRKLRVLQGFLMDFSIFWSFVVWNLERQPTRCRYSSYVFDSKTTHFCPFENVGWCAVRAHDQKLQRVPFLSSFEAAGPVELQHNQLD